MSDPADKHVVSEDLYSQTFRLDEFVQNAFCANQVEGMGITHRILLPDEFDNPVAINKVVEGRLALRWSSASVVNEGDDRIFLLRP